MPAVQPPSIYEVGGPSTMAAEGPSFPLPTPGLLIPPSVGAQVEQGQQTATQRDEVIVGLTHMCKALQEVVHAERHNVTANVVEKNPQTSLVLLVL
ncbi:hypothetical protein Tco_0230822 [Tanacetum coccineum]